MYTRNKFTEVLLYVDKLSYVLNIPKLLCEKILLWVYVQVRHRLGCTVRLQLFNQRGYIVYESITIVIDVLLPYTLFMTESKTDLHMLIDLAFSNKPSFK